MPTELYTEPGLRVLWVPRKEWGSLQSTEDYIANRPQISLTARTEQFVHHTASVDGSDSTPNSWEYGHAATYMRALQWVRPDLGPLPYPENLAVDEDGERVWLFEGRGFTALPAHASGHNVSAYAIGIFGNFDQLETWPGMHRAVQTVRWRSWDLRTNHGFTNLGNDKNPNGWDLWGHRDDSTKSCPGNYLYPLLSGYPFVEWSPDMAFLPITPDSPPAVIAWLQRRVLATLDVTLPGGADGKWSDELEDAIALIPDSTPGVVGGNDWANLEELYVKAVAGTGTGVPPHSHTGEVTVT